MQQRPERANLATRLGAWLRLEPRATHDILFAALLAAIVALCVKAGAVPMRNYPFDIILLADNGWRAVWGLRPHADFSSAFGPVTFLLMGAGLKLAGDSINGVGVGSAIAGLIIGPWAYALLVRRVRGVTAVIGAAMLTLLSLAPAAVGEPFRLSSHAMAYNRYAFAVLGLIIIEGFPLRAEREARGLGGAVSTGAALAILLFLKPNFFTVGAVIVLLSLFWTGRIEARRVAGLAAGFGAAAFPFLFYIRFAVPAMISDLRMAAIARGAGISIAHIANCFADGLAELIILLALAVIARADDPAETGVTGLIRRYRLPLLVLAIYGAAALLLATNTQSGRLPPVELLGLLLVDCFLASKRSRVAAAAIAIGLTVSVIPAGTDALALLNGVRLKLHYRRDAAYQVRSGNLAGLVVLDDYTLHPECEHQSGEVMAGSLNDALSLLQSHVRRGDRVGAFDIYNPFPQALGIEPPRGGMAAAISGFMYNSKVHPSADFFFGDANVIMYPRNSLGGPSYFHGLLTVYGNELERRYAVAAESPQWVMYRKRS